MTPEEKTHEETGVTYTVWAVPTEDLPGQFIGYWKCGACNHTGGSSFLADNEAGAARNAEDNFHGHASSHRRTG
jgi:hypothetical protein